MFFKVFLLFEERDYEIDLFYIFKLSKYVWNVSIQSKIVEI